MINHILSIRKNRMYKKGKENKEHKRNQKHRIKTWKSKLKSSGKTKF